MNTVVSHTKYKTCQLIENVKNKTGTYVTPFITVKNWADFYNFLQANAAYSNN